jgi:hypothetical protein
MNRKRKPLTERFEFKLSREELDKLHRIAGERYVSAATLLRRSIHRLKEGIDEKHD